ncbi:hypothetical protein HD554DRAFT_1771877 [Boletus coccyginus]|nr:hypothetical protein HD554DRAFT_1771877 [Boletus coccyginus]
MVVDPFQLYHGPAKVGSSHANFSLVWPRSAAANTLFQVPTTMVIESRRVYFSTSGLDGPSNNLNNDHMHHHRKHVLGGFLAVVPVRLGGRTRGSLNTISSGSIELKRHPNFAGNVRRGVRQSIQKQVESSSLFHACSMVGYPPLKMEKRP